jgi:LPXTG-motif cell wall-anchored protein
MNTFVCVLSVNDSMTSGGFMITSVAGFFFMKKKRNRKDYLLRKTLFKAKFYKVPKAKPQCPKTFMMELSTVRYSSQRAKFKRKKL